MNAALQFQQLERHEPVVVLVGPDEGRLTEHGAVSGRLEVKNLGQLDLCKNDTSCRGVGAAEKDLGQLFEYLCLHLFGTGR